MQTTPAPARTPLPRLLDARERTDALFSLVQPAALSQRPIPARHRLVFYVGHVDTFDWNLLKEPLGLASFDRHLDDLFAFGIDPVDGGLPSDTPVDWPTMAQITAYVHELRGRLDARLRDLDAASTPGLDTRLLEVAIEHRLMHAETLAYLVHQLPYDQKSPQLEARTPSTAPPEADMVTVPAGATVLGRAEEDDGFGWDNEYGAHTVDVPAFAIDRYPVTNRQFAEFVQAGGYNAQPLWTAEDWAWRVHADIEHPQFWIRRGRRWTFRSMFQETPLPPDWPVYVSHAEAAAYARWTGKRLPSEAQWHRAAYGTPDGRERRYPWGQAPPDPTRGNFDFVRWNPVSVSAHPAGSSAFGVMDLLGNGWEWTRDVFAPFPGFSPFPFYPGYSANFFDGQHFVMKGGSCRTAACFVRRSFRNWFQPHYPYIYTSFRCVIE
ncbi:MAG: ergothioneine biosynthesis protein EgtB [Luteitalea sp.]|nr:ergothioneine biosynthesis protein EgtB [Luteitalea sp.]